MKKLVTVLLSVLLLFSVAGCGNYAMMNKVESEADKVKDEVKDDANEIKDDVKNGVSDMMPSDNSSENNTSSAKISAEQAKKRALEHAGLKETDIFDFDIDKDMENGVLCYDIDFETDTHEYEYLIDANTGAVKHSKKEPNR